MEHPVFLALLATLGTWLLTALGAATVAFFRSPSEKWMDLSLGFAAGVMIAASFWSLLQPAIEQAEAMGRNAALMAAGGFLTGALFLWASDRAVNLARGTAGEKNRILLLVSAITLHNIPEGLAVGVAFGALAANPGREGLMGAVSLAVGIGLQNFPEGAAVSLPLRAAGCSRRRSFWIGQASGLVEPAAGVLGARLVVYARAVLPYALSFAAGAMILVAVHELIPECQKRQAQLPYFSTMGIILGFAMMMFLDVALG